MERHPHFCPVVFLRTLPPPPPSPDCCQAKIIAHKPRPSRRKELSLGKNQQQIDIQKQVHKSDQSSNPYKWFFARSSEFGEKGQPEMARSSLHQAPQVEIGKRTLIRILTFRRLLPGFLRVWQALEGGGCPSRSHHGHEKLRKRRKNRFPSALPRMLGRDPLASRAGASQMEKLGQGRTSQLWPLSSRFF